MTDDKFRSMLKEQINKEFYSAYLYLSVSTYFSEIGLCGFSHWAEVRSREKLYSGMKMLKVPDISGTGI